MNTKRKIIKNHNVLISTMELTTLEFLQFDENVLKKFTTSKIDKLLISELIKCVVQSSFNIYCHRDVIDA